MVGCIFCRTLNRFVCHFSTQFINHSFKILNARLSEFVQSCTELLYFAILSVPLLSKFPLLFSVSHCGGLQCVTMNGVHFLTAKRYNTLLLKYAIAEVLPYWNIPELGIEQAVVGIHTIVEMV